LCSKKSLTAEIPEPWIGLLQWSPREQTTTQDRLRPGGVALPYHLVATGGG